MIGAFKDHHYEPLGMALDRLPADWLKENDVPLPFDVDPEEFRKRLFAASGFDAAEHSYRLARPVNGGFFMMSLHIENTHCIGHGPPTSLFKLSTFAHELGLLLGDRFDVTTIEEFKLRLLKRKAIQFNQHLLASRLSWMYFSGADLKEISTDFSATMKRIFPRFEPSASLEWLAHATLDRPLSKLGFLRAYDQTFLKVEPKPETEDLT